MSECRKSEKGSCEQLVPVVNGRYRWLTDNPNLGQRCLRLQEARPEDFLSRSRTRRPNPSAGRQGAFHWRSTRWTKWKSGSRRELRSTAVRRYKTNSGMALNFPNLAHRQSACPPNLLAKHWERFYRTISASGSLNERSIHRLALSSRLA
jgi:hypothetical protein